MVKQVVSIERPTKESSPKRELIILFKMLENVFSETKIYKID